MNSFNKRMRLNSPENYGYSPQHNEDVNNNINGIITNPLKWPQVITEIWITILFPFCIFYFIMELHEASHSDTVSTTRKINNYVEAMFLFITSVLICINISLFRFKRNWWKSVTFDNYSMLTLLCIYALIEIFYYSLDYISIMTSSQSTSRYFATSTELISVIVILPFLIICVKNKAKAEHPWMKMINTLTIILTMIGSSVIFSRKVTIKLKRDFENRTLDDSINSTNILIHRFCRDAIEFLEIIDINYFIIATILLINPLLNVNRYNDPRETLETETSLSLKGQPGFSILQWMSMVRFRLFTVLLSFGMIGVLFTGFYISTSIMINKNIEPYVTSLALVIFFSLLTLSYIIVSIYSVYYYFADIRSWSANENQGLNSDHYFNYLTSFSQIVYSCTQFLNVITDRNNKCSSTESALCINQLINYFLLCIQILIQAKCIHSASLRTPETFKDGTSWKSRLIPPFILASFNFIAMIISMGYAKYSDFSIVTQENASEKNIWIFTKDLALPLTILNRFHAMTFFISLTIKQWNYTMM